MLLVRTSMTSMYSVASKPDDCGNGNMQPHTMARYSLLARPPSGNPMMSMMLTCLCRNERRIGH